MPHDLNEKEAFIKQDTMFRFRERLVQPLTTLQGNVQFLEAHPDAPDREEIEDDIRAAWQDFFVRLADFRRSSFPEFGNLTIANLDRMMALEHNDPLAPGTYQRLKSIYEEIIPPRDPRFDISSRPT